MTRMFSLLVTTKATKQSLRRRFARESLIASHSDIAKKCTRHDIASVSILDTYIAEQVDIKIHIKLFCGFIS